MELFIYVGPVLSEYARMLVHSFWKEPEMFHMIIIFDPLPIITDNIYYCKAKYSLIVMIFYYIVYLLSTHISGGMDPCQLLSILS